jgi:hypothetical protein
MKNRLLAVLHLTVLFLPQLAYTAPVCLSGNNELRAVGETQYEICPWHIEQIQQHIGRCKALTRSADIDHDAFQIAHILAVILDQQGQSEAASLYHRSAAKLRENLNVLEQEWNDNLCF